MTAVPGGRPVPRARRSWPGEPDGLWRAFPSIEHVPDARPAEERLEALLDPPLFDYPRGRAVREGVSAAALGPRSCPWPGLMLCGPAGNGRSVTARGIVDRVRRRAGGERAARMTWMPARPTPAAFWLALGDALGTPDPGTGGTAAFREARLVDEVRTQARDGLRLVVVDGCDGLLPARATTMRAVVGCVRHVTAATGVPVLMVGSTRLAARLRRDRDHVGSFEFIELPPWRLDEDYLALLRSFEAVLPLRLPSRLADRELALHLWAVSDGLIGPLSSILRTAAEAAIRLSYESIDIELLDDIGVSVPEAFNGFFF